MNLQWVLLILHFKQSLIKRGAHYVRLTQNFPYLLIKILSIREALCTRHCSGLGRVIVMTQYELSHGLISPCSLGGLHLYLQSSEILLMSDLRGLSRYQSGRRRRMSPKRKYSCVDTVGKRHFLITERSDYCGPQRERRSTKSPWARWRIPVSSTDAVLSFNLLCVFPRGSASEKWFSSWIITAFWVESFRPTAMLKWLINQSSPFT